MTHYAPTPSEMKLIRDCMRLFQKMTGNPKQDKKPKKTITKANRTAAVLQSIGKLEQK